MTVWQAGFSSLIIPVFTPTLRPGRHLFLNGEKTQSVTTLCIFVVKVISISQRRGQSWSGGGFPFSRRTYSPRPKHRRCAVCDKCHWLLTEEETKVINWLELGWDWEPEKGMKTLGEQRQKEAIHQTPFWCGLYVLTANLLRKANFCSVA